MPLTCDDLWRELRSFAETSLRRELEEIRKQIKQDLAYELSLAPRIGTGQISQLSSVVSPAPAMTFPTKLETVPDKERLPDAATNILNEVGAGDDGPHEWMTRHMRGFAVQAEVQEAEAEMVEHQATLAPRVSRRSLARKGTAPLGGRATVSKDRKSAHPLFRASGSRSQMFEKNPKRFNSVISKSSEEGAMTKAYTEGSTGKPPSEEDAMAKSQTEPTRRSDIESEKEGGKGKHVAIALPEDKDAWKQVPSPDAVHPCRVMEVEHSSDDDNAEEPSQARFSGASVASVDSALVKKYTAEFTAGRTIDFDTHDSICSDDIAASWMGMSQGDVTATASAKSRMRWADFGGMSRCREAVLALVRHEIFDAITGLLIIVNSMTIGFQVDYMVRNIVMVPPLEYRVVEYFFCCAFATELGLRIFAYQLQIFRIPGWRWNLFDVFVVSIQILETLMTLITSSDDSVKFDFSIMRILRVLRLVRIVRLVRVLRVISELRTMVYSIFGTLKPFCWTVMLLVLLVYMVGVQFTQMVADYKVTMKEEAEEGRLDEVELDKHFGSLPRGLFSLYQSLSGGIDWGEVCWPLIDHVSPLAGVMFSIYIAFAIFALLNVVTGVFVQSAMRAAKEDNDVYLVNHVRELFENTDTDGSGKISWEEFEDQLESKAMREYFKHIDIDISEAQGLFFLLDMDGSGTIDADEFLNGSLRLRGPAKAIEIALIMRTLKWLAEHAQKSRKLQERIIVELVRRTGRPTTVNQGQVLRPKSAGEHYQVRPKSAGDVGFEEPVSPTLKKDSPSKTNSLQNGQPLPKTIEDVRSKLDNF